MTHAGRLLGSLALAAMIVSAVPASAEESAASFPQPPEETFSPRVTALVSAMTLDEKLGITQGQVDPIDPEQAGYSPGVPRLGIPPLRWVDGPGGIDNLYEATSLPQPIALAASFDPALAYRYGVVNGRETRATGMDVFLGPMVNIARLPTWGRNATSLGEDPFLASRIVAPVVRGIQEQGVIASTKHYVGNNQSEGIDTNRHETLVGDFLIDDRTLHEIYLPAFAAAIDAGTGSLMAAYNRVNGYPNAGNPDLLNTILRGELGFRGFVESDWGAVHSTDAMAGGLDVEFTGYGLFNKRTLHFGQALRQSIEDGHTPVAVLDRSVSRVLTQMDRIGMLDNSRVPGPMAVEIEAGAEVARAVAERGIVLLANDGVLPLSAAAQRSLALIGPTAGALAANPGFGSALGITERKIAPVDAMRAAGAQVAYAVGQNLQGAAIPASALTPANGLAGQGLARVPQDGTAITVDPSVDFVGDNALPFGRAYTWRGTLRVPETGDYVLMAQSWGGRTELFVDGAVVARSAYPFFGGAAKKTSSLLPTAEGLDNGRAPIRLEAGRDYTVELQGQAWADAPFEVRLAWYTPEMRRADIAQAVATARRAETAVVFAWQRAGEQADPGAGLVLPEGQDALIEAIIAANPNTVVVLTSGPVQMPWLDDARAVVEMWYPGQEGGLAIADMLLGRTNPGGRLPITFPRQITDSPAFAEGHPERYRGDAEHRITYSEGIFTGYRWFDEQEIAPLFPFGHGLSYTSFAYSDLRVTPVADGLQVRFTVRNSGSVAGSEVPQVYVGRPDHAPVPMARQALAAFERIDLAPGESRTLTLTVPTRQMSYWDSESRSWTLAPGARSVAVGASSRDLRLTARATPR